MVPLRITLEAYVDSGWEELVAADGNSSFFHQAIWLEVLAGAYPYYHPSYFLALDDAGRLLGGLPAVRSVRFGLTQLLSLPYGAYGAPLARADSRVERDSIRAALLERWLQEMRRPGVVRAHLVLFTPPGGETIRLEIPGRETVVERTHLADLRAGFESLWSSGFEGDKRTDSRKAERLGVVVIKESGSSAAQVMEDLYRDQAAEWTDHTPFPPGLFHSLLERAPNSVLVWVARFEGKPVAAHLVLYHKQMASTWIGVAQPDARRLGAGNYIYKVMIEDAADRGLAFFNLGGSRGRPALESFKAGLGGVPREYQTYLHEAAWFKPAHRLLYKLRGLREPV